MPFIYTSPHLSVFAETDDESVSKIGQMKGIKYYNRDKCYDADSYGVVKTTFADGNKSIFGKACQKVQPKKWHKNYEYVNISTVNVTPENGHWHYQPDV